MIIKSKSRLKIKKKNKNLFSKFLYIYFFLTFSIGVLFIVMIFQSHLFYLKKNKILDIFSKAGRYEYLYLPNIIFKGIKSNFSSLKKIQIEIPFEETIILENLRKKSILEKRLPSSDVMPRVKANIIFNNKKLETNMRLKGDRLVHFEDKKNSSYRFELKDDKYILGVKKFSLQKPRVRNYIHEWLFHELSAENDIIKLIYEFIYLEINGEDQGLYVLEEAFGKELIERNKRRNGPIFGLNEDIYELQDTPVFEIYNKNFWAKSENNALARVASQKLKDFWDDKLNLEDVFDLEKWAAYFAIIDLTATHHGAFLKSVKLYYNPINGLFEPIPFDGHRLKPNYHKYNQNYDNRILIDIVQNPIGDEITGFAWLKKFFYEKDDELNQIFYNLYTLNLNRISSQEYIDKFLSKNKKEIEKINSHIYADYFLFDNSRSYGPGLYYFLLSDFNHHANNIKNKLKMRNNIQLIKIGENEFEFNNYYKNYNQLFFLTLNCIQDNKTINININKQINNFKSTKINLNKNSTNNIKCVSVSLYDKLSNTIKDLKIDEINSKFVYENFKNKFNANLDKFFINDNNILYLKNNIIEIDRNIYIPKGFKVIIKPGEKIYLINNAFIISNSPWFIGGVKEKTIIAGKKNNLGGGLLIGDNKETSIVYNTEFYNLNGMDLMSNTEYLILGSINFHQTNVELRNVIFKDIYSEDAINLFRTSFDILNADFRDISSDAIDVDFSEGKIENTFFSNISNDAIDFSGSIVNVKNAYFEKVGDKIISAGEESNLEIDKIEGQNSFAGIISKDGSIVNSNDIMFDRVLFPFATYQKKNQYKFPFLKASNFKTENYLVNSIKDETSTILISDDTKILKTKKINSLIYEKNLSLIE